MLGGYISDLEKGDVFKPVEYVITSVHVQRVRARQRRRRASTSTPRAIRRGGRSAHRR